MTDLKELWPVAPLSEAAKARMIARATAAPQVLPWPRAAAAALERSLVEWRYAMPYKLAAAVACVVIGLGIGLNLQPRDHDIDGLSSVASAPAGIGELSE